MASENTFDSWKVVFSWGKMRKSRFSQNPLNSRFWAVGFLIYTLSSANFKKIHLDKFNESQSMFLPLVFKKCKFSQNVSTPKCTRPNWILARRSHPRLWPSTTKHLTIKPLLNFGNSSHPSSSRHRTNQTSWIDLISTRYKPPHRRDTRWFASSASTSSYCWYQL